MRITSQEQTALARDPHMSVFCMKDGVSKAESPQMFDRISRRYDLLNHLLSFGQDLLWRRKLSQTIRAVRHDVVVDLACGTCDQILSAFRHNPDIRLGCAIDMAGRMLRIGSTKVERSGLKDRIRLIRGDGLHMPLADGSVDCATISFGIRNFIDADRALFELYRILKPGGTLAVLEFSLPEKSFIRAVYLLYFRHILPWAGSVISGDRSAYKYLNKTVEDFYSREEFGAMMSNAGFSDLAVTGLTFGTATIYIGKR